MGNGIRHYWSAWCMLLCTRLCRSGTDPCCDKTWKKSCIYERMHSTKNGNYRRCPAGSRGVFAAARQCADAVYL